MGLTLQERDKKVIWHPYTPQKYAPESIPIVKGEGALLWDDQGNSYIDAISSWWVTIHGHAHPYIAGKIHEQALKLEQVIFAGFTHEPAVKLAERLLEILPGGFSRVFYSDNGSTATEVAIKMAIQFWWNRGEKKRTRILALTHSYHGDTFGAMSVSERGLFTLAFHDRLFEVIFTDPQNPLNDPSVLKECACVIYEPLLQGAGGMKMYTAEGMDKFISLCRSYDVICIADEVMTGFGRTGKMFASSHCYEQPDIICLSKGITGGTMALGVTACTEKIHDAFVVEDKSKTFFHGHSFTANPLACTAALASLDLFEQENTMQHVDRITARHVQFAEQLRSLNNVKNIRLCGTVIAFEVRDTVDGYASDARERITEKSLKKGVYIRPLGNTVYLMPPYCISDEELDKVYQTVIEVIAD
jgi:adenosylmethionine---8-amino-7-oxononanoate aminotransferase